MTKTYVDGIMRQWGERYDWSSGFSKPKMKRSSVSLVPVKSTGNAVTARATLQGLTRKVPQVMVKVTGGSRTQKGARDSINYIAREDGKEKDSVELVDQDGIKYFGADEVRFAASAFVDDGMPITESSKKRQTFSVVLSMPPGTDREAVAKAADDFARKQFPDHQYLIAHHRDEPQPHAHIIVKARSSVDGKSLNIRKATLQKWRAGFVKTLGENGVEAVATHSRTRFKTPKGRNWAKHANPSKDPNARVAIPEATLREVEKDHARVADVLASSTNPTDRALSKDIRHWIKSSFKGINHDSEKSRNPNLGPEIGATLRRDLYNVRSGNVAKTIDRSSGVLPGNAHNNLDKQRTGGKDNGLRRQPTNGRGEPSR